MSRESCWCWVSYGGGELKCARGSHAAAAAEEAMAKKNKS